LIEAGPEMENNKTKGAKEQVQEQVQHHTPEHFDKHPAPQTNLVLWLTWTTR
jgi:hypothetical protein